MSDRELLELAAKAAGISFEYVNCDNGKEVFKYRPSPIHELVQWHPLRYDGDALRLAVTMYRRQFVESLLVFRRYISQAKLCKEAE